MEKQFFDEFSDVMDFILGQEGQVNTHRLIKSANERRDALKALGYSYGGERYYILRRHGYVARGIPDIHSRTFHEYLNLKSLISRVLPDSPESDERFDEQADCEIVSHHGKNQISGHDKDSLCNDKFNLSYILGREIDVDRLEREAKNRRDALKALGYSYNTRMRHLEGEKVDIMPMGAIIPEIDTILWDELKTLDYLYSYVFPHAPRDKLLVF